MPNLTPAHFRVPKSSRFRLTPCGIGVHDFETMGVDDDQVFNHIKVFFNELCNVIDVTIFSFQPQMCRVSLHDFLVIKVGQENHTFDAFLDGFLLAHRSEQRRTCRFLRWTGLRCRSARVTGHIKLLRSGQMKVMNVFPHDL